MIPTLTFFAANSQLLSHCLYLTSTEFNKIPPLCFDTFSSLHINIRSLPKHFDDLSEFLLTLNRSFSIIAVSETWLHRSNSDLFHLPVQEDKFLGIIIHENLSWKPHISAVYDKVSKVIGVLCKSRRYLPLNTLKTLNNSLFLPYINYCSLIWASTYASYLKPLYVLQKKAVRVITFSPPRTSSKPLFSKHNILSLYSIYKFHVACFVFSHFNSLLPTPVSSILHFNSEYHDYMTRSRFNLHKTCHKYQFAITWQAPIIWNDIPLTVRNNLTVSNFKKNLRLYFSE